MKKLSFILIILALAFVSCNDDDSISAKDKRETKQKSEENFEPTSLSDDGNSYWYVVAEKKDKGYKISNVIKQNHKHFSLIEAKESFDGGVFILNFIQISEETYDEQQ